MATVSHDLNLIVKARDDVRLKGNDGTYFKSLAFDVYLSQKHLKDLMDEERWLQDPPGGPAKWVKPSEEPEATNNDEGGAISLAEHFVDDETPEESIKVFTLGCYDRILWLPGEGAVLTDRSQDPPNDPALESGFRVPTEATTAYKVLTRACRVINPGQGMHASTQFSKQALGISEDDPLTLGHDINAVVVGVSALDCSPVIMQRHESDQGSQQGTTDSTDQVVEQSTPHADHFKDGNSRIILRSYSGGLCGRRIIYFQNVLIPGNLSHIKKGLYNHLETSDKQKFLQIMKREHLKLSQGLSTSSVARILPSTEDDGHRPNLRRPVRASRDDRGCKNYDELQYKLRWPPMAVLKFPPNMVVGVSNFLNRYISDVVPLNIALAAIVIFFDEEQRSWETECFATSLPDKHQVPRVSLSVFVLYFHHMLRFVENNHLTAFIHPARFAEINYAQDKNKCNGSFDIQKHVLDEHTMRQWYTEIRSRCRDVSVKKRYTLIPSSMPGSTMVFPSGYSPWEVERPSKKLFALCLLDDVRTFGLPSYSWGHIDYISLGGPRYLFKEKPEPPNLVLEGIPDSWYWVPNPSRCLVALTGRARSVGPIFQSITPYHDKRSTARTSIDWFHKSGGVDLDVVLSPQMRIEVAQKIDALYRIAARFDIPRPEIRTCRVTLRPYWNSMEENIKELQTKGELESIIYDKRVIREAEPEHSPPPAKRPRTKDSKNSAN
ncbi:hypothetical protein HG530_009413 [Fusarium avenaceum]|nr:hypothetical protein HG530_009413 [Fusarium avenaceum]